MQWKIHVDHPEGINLSAQKQVPNPKGVEEIWPRDVSIGKVLSNGSLTNWANPWGYLTPIYTLIRSLNYLMGLH